MSAATDGAGPMPHASRRCSSSRRGPTEGLDRPESRRNNRDGQMMVPRLLEWFDSLMTEIVPGESRAVPSSDARESKAEVDVATHGDRLGEPISRIVGVYQIVLRRTLEHFFPGAQLEMISDR